MAEQDAQQHTADVKEEDTQSTHMDCVSGSYKYKPEETNITEHISKERDSIEDKTEGSPPDDYTVQNVEGNSTPPQADDGSHGDSREGQKNEQPTITGEHHTGENKTPETTTSPTLGDRKDDQVDGHIAGTDDETPGTNNIVSEDDEGVLVTPEEEKDVQEDIASPQTAVLQQISVTEESDKQTTDVENIGPTTEQNAAEPIVPANTGILGGNITYLGICIVLVLAILVQHLRQPESPPQKNDTRKIDIFLEQMEKVKAQFPNQRAELWNRSKIHLLKHLRAAQPTEPVSLILTAGLRAEKTLQCLAQGLASAFSSALNASVLHIDGASKARQDSDQVKLDIDNNLQGAFEGDKPVAVIHRFEELPPGSTLIFYRYCDHENAAYKKTCLMFTVLLGEEEEIPANSHLSIVEEMVDDHLQKKFLSDGHPVSYDRMDLDKYGGLWSRISHLILPVVAEERIEHEGCSET